MKQYIPLSKNDYEEPRCILCDPDKQQAASVPLERILQKLDEYCGKKEFAAAERHLKYWLEEARFCADERGRFSLMNEMMGFYRKQNEKEKAIDAADCALKLMHGLALENTLSAATCYVNCGTVYDAFSFPQKALSCFEQAKTILEKDPSKDPYKLGSLYNNMALAYADTGCYNEALDCFQKALDVMETVPNGQLEQAITCLNMTDAYVQAFGFEESESFIAAHLERAFQLLRTDSLPKDAYYAFVCEKCAPGFYCYGYAEYAARLEKSAEEIYQTLSGNEKNSYV